MSSEKIFEELVRKQSSPSENGKYSTIPFRTCRDIADGLGMTYRDAEIAALRLGVCPSRYERSIGTIGIEGQIKLLESRVAVAGLGGLGGLIADLLARAGVGHLILIDGDDFSESNLNRQILCTEADLGRGKAEVAFERASAINDAIDVEVIGLYIESDEDAEYFLSSADLVVDALDNNKTRKIVSDRCKKNNIPFVHGAIAGLWAQAGVFYPTDRTPWDTIEDLPDKGAELETGNPPFTPAFCAAVQVALAVEVIAGMGDVKGGVLRWYDLCDWGIEMVGM